MWFAFHGVVLPILKLMRSAATALMHSNCVPNLTRGAFQVFPFLPGLYPNHTRSPLPLRAAAFTILTMSDAADLSPI